MIAVITATECHWNARLREINRKFVFTCHWLSLIILPLFHGESNLQRSERWLSVEEIARHLGVSKESIYRWLERAKIPAHRVGKLWKFKVSEVDRWVTVGGAEEPAASGLLNKTKKRQGTHSRGKDIGKCLD